MEASGEEPLGMTTAQSSMARSERQQDVQHWLKSEMNQQR